MLKSIVATTLTLLISLTMAVSAPAQEGKNLELSGGFGYVSGNGGTSGLNAGAAFWFTPRVSLAADYDLGWDTSRLGVFETTSSGLTVNDTNLQNWLFGPRINLTGLVRSTKVKGNVLFPFTEILLGISHLSSTVTSQNLGSTNSSDTAFSWLLGGGADVKISPKWVGRMKVDLLRTHFASAGQSKIRIALGVAYTFRERR